MARRNNRFCFVCDRILANHMGFVQHCRASLDHHWCDGCERVYETKSELNDHLSRSLHTKPATCTACDVEFCTHKDWLEHGRSKRDHPWCEQCLMPLKDEYAVSGHLKNSPEPHISCQQCTKTFRDPEHLAQHFAAKHASAPLQNPIPSQPPSTNRSEHHVINNAAPQVSNIEPPPAASVSSPPQPNPPIEESFSTVNTSDETSQVELVLGYSCERCDKVFEKAWHVELHNVRRHLMCIACKVFFDKKHELEVHNASMHLLETVCPNCTMSFTEISGFIYHLEEHLCPLMNFDKKPSLIESLAALDGPWKNPNYDKDGNLFRCCACHKLFNNAFLYSYHSARPCCADHHGGLTTGMPGVYVLLIDLSWRWDMA